MINMIFIVPYPELQEKVQTIFWHHSAKTTISPHIFVEIAERVDQLEYNCDVIVARGYTANKLKKRLPNIPIIELPITSYDIFRSIQECQRLYQARRIAIIGIYSGLHDVSMLSELFECDVRIYCPPSISDIYFYMQRVIQDGCDAIIGGYSACRYADRYHIPSVVIKTGDEAIISALNEAVRTVEVIQNEQERAQMYKTITQYSQDGILYVDSKKNIRIINNTAVSLYQGSRKILKGCPLQEIYPFMFSRTEEVLSTGNELSNELQHYGDTILSISYIPVVVSRSIAGVVINFQDITKIQHLEAQVRQKLSAKGLHAKYTFEDVVNHSPSLNRTIQIAQHYASVSSNVLIIGETGTGKELFAQSIHNASNRKDGPFVAINCASLNESLLESELFGYVDGAFTGASKGGKVGLFELAHHGTLFLDEISEIPLNLQGKLLRVLQEREVRRVGDIKVISVDVRVIAATNRSLQEMVESGTFRRDLLYRLDVLKLKIPPLRQRKEDIEGLFWRFISENNKRFGYHITEITKDAMNILINHNFLGNVRELQNIAERISVLKSYGTIQKEDVIEALFTDDMNEADSTVSEKGSSMLIKANTEKDRIISALKSSEGNQTQAAAMLGINRATLWRKLKKYQLSSNSFR